MEPADQSVVIGCAADRGWGLPLAVMLRSVGDHLPADRPLHAFVVDGGLSRDERAGVVASVHESTRIEWRMPASGRAAVARLWGHYSDATYYRLALGRLLPADLLRAIWLDCDILVLGDLSSLMDRDLGGATVLAVQDSFIRVVSSPYGLRSFAALGLRADAPYFNAGVMVVDLERWRETDVEQAALAYLSEHDHEVLFHDQDALNAVLADRWRPVEPRWNRSANPMHARQNGSGAEQPMIVHFSGSRKPWRHGGRGAVYDTYLRCVDATEWRGARPRLTRLGRLALWYEQWPLRTLTFPVENIAMRMRRRLGRAGLSGQ